MKNRTIVTTTPIKATEMHEVFETIIKDLEEKSKAQKKPKSFEQLMEELDKVKADAEHIVNMGLSAEAEVIVLAELCQKKDKIIAEMHHYVDTL